MTDEGGGALVKDVGLLCTGGRRREMATAWIEQGDFDIERKRRSPLRYGRNE
jgi:hypothetical protein